MSCSCTVCRDYANKSGSNTCKKLFLELLTSFKVKYKVLDWQESEIIQKFYENVAGVCFFTNFYRECMGIGNHAFGVFAYSPKWRQKL